jgi:hypothetical protein
MIAELPLTAVSQTMESLERPDYNNQAMFAQREACCAMSR